MPTVTRTRTLAALPDYVCHYPDCVQPIARVAQLSFMGQTQTVTWGAGGRPGWQAEYEHGGKVFVVDYDGRFSAAGYRTDLPPNTIYYGPLVSTGIVYTCPGLSASATETIPGPDYCLTLDDVQQRFHCQETIAHFGEGTEVPFAFQEVPPGGTFMARAAGGGPDDAEDARPVPPSTFPPLLQQAASFARSTITHVAAGRPRTDDATLVARLAVCGGCDHLKDGRCLACGCGVKDKAVRALEACPLGRWPEPTDPRLP